VDNHRSGASDIRGLLMQSGGRFISYEFVRFPEEKLESLISSRATEGELELSGAFRVTISAWWYWLSKRFSPGVFWVDAKVNGHKVHLVLDTGSNTTDLDPQVAVNAKVTLTEKRGIAFGARKEWTTSFYWGQLQELEIDGLLARNLPVTVRTKRRVFKLLGIPIYHEDGFLGMDLLQHLAIRMDFQNGVVTLSREPLSSKGYSAPLRVIEASQSPVMVEGRGGIGPLPIVEGLVDNSGPFPFLIDTGASGPALIGKEVWKALGLEGREGEKVTLERVKLGEIELHNVPAIKDEAEHRRKIILLGSGIFLSNGYKRLTLDFLTGKLYAER